MDLYIDVNKAIAESKMPEPTMADLRVSGAAMNVTIEQPYDS